MNNRFQVKMHNKKWNIKNIDSFSYTPVVEFSRGLKRKKVESSGGQIAVTFQIKNQPVLLAIWKGAGGEEVRWEFKTDIGRIKGRGKVVKYCSPVELTRGRSGEELVIWVGEKPPFYE